MFGVSDSEKQGWVANTPDGNTQTARIEVETPLGVIIAEVSPASDYPGIALSFRPYNDTFERTVALMEASSADTVDMKVWEDERLNEDWQHCIQIEKSKPMPGIKREMAQLESIMKNPQGYTEKTLRIFEEDLARMKYIQGLWGKEQKELQMAQIRHIRATWERLVDTPSDSTGAVLTPFVVNYHDSSRVLKEFPTGTRRAEIGYWLAEAFNSAVTSLI